MAMKILTNIFDISFRNSLFFQKWWMRLSTLCHGLLGGLALRPLVVPNLYYSSTGRGFSVILCRAGSRPLCVVCIVSVFDRVDIAHVKLKNLKELLNTGKVQ
ncbi:hypothetical protein NQ317_016825 [Molorchus minor]|uniref:Uncharacterized protein n=1 Tax=Molorchus minor TaxID=1323400 RepID=A0ABQ9JLT8_9CUCU|nr:hypothetical protein NQ317_016825 [Molorchus minor]